MNVYFTANYGIQYFSAFLVKISHPGYYSGIGASILDQPAGFQFLVATILVRSAYAVIAEGSFVGASLVGF